MLRSFIGWAGTCSYASWRCLLGGGGGGGPCPVFSSRSLAGPIWTVPCQGDFAAVTYFYFYCPADSPTVVRGSLSSLRDGTVLLPMALTCGCSFWPGPHGLAKTHKFIGNCAARSKNGNRGGKLGWNRAYQTGVSSGHSVDDPSGQWRVPNWPAFPQREPDPPRRLAAWS